MFADENRAFLTRLFAEHSPDDLALARRGSDRHLRDLGFLYPTLPCHFRLDRATHDELLSATARLVSAHQKVMEHVCSSLSPGELAETFRIPEAMASHIDWKRMSAGMALARADIIPTDSGYAFCELNTFSGVGGGECHHSAKLHAELLGHPVAGASPFLDLARHYLSQCTRLGLERLVILDSVRHAGRGYGRDQPLVDFLRAMAPDLDVVYCDETSYRPEWLRAPHARKTLVHRLITFADTDDDGAFLKAVDDSGATVSCMFEAELGMHRKWFSLLCDPGLHHLLDAAESETVRRYVPETFDLGPDNLDDVLAARTEYVFKHSYTYGGDGVLIGAEHPEQALRDRFLADGADTWTCQRMVRASTLDLPVGDGSQAAFSFVLGVYAYGDRTNGALVRGSADSKVVNASRGAISWAFAD
ncbi:hypothetical protein [Embleya sp. NBC_00896]|uniref:hypothetical protein n=1 Tax=Embleya sp. NBC_00896 TaxID=2975961 RepID=UPI003867C3D5|nr:hypothetical protein OG928_07330 [Embleya sp. NBC_00896]